MGHKTSGLALGDDVPGRSGGGGKAAKSAEGESRRYNDARDQFHFAALAAQAVDEHAPAKLGDRGELG